MSDTEPRWLTEEVIHAIHGMLLAEHGGGTGIRDEGLLAPALAAPRNRFGYGDQDVFNLAAAYAFAPVRNHPFVDGNKRTAFTAAGVFLELNGQRLVAPETDAVAAVVALVTGEMDAAGFADWLRISSEPDTGDD